MFVFVLSFFTYLLLSWSGGASIQEVTIAFFLAAFVSFIAAKFSRSGFWGARWFHPRRVWHFFYFVFGPYAKAMWDCNVDVAKRVMNGQINPGIGKFDSRLKTDVARMMLALFIVLTPGTYVVDIDDDGVFYIHSICLPYDRPPTEADLCRHFAVWVRRIAE
jgi:multicomponent Na+:H+ antiporter subunit E